MSDVSLVFQPAAAELVDECGEVAVPGWLMVAETPFTSGYVDDEMDNDDY